MSSGTLQTDSFINRISGYIIYLQEQNVFSKERIQSLIRNFLMTVGLFVSLYFLIQIQIFIFWLLKLIFRPIFQIISIIFWLPLKTVRFLIPKTIDYDILFPLFWLCSISSFYISKFFHENICQFYDQYLVQRYKIFNYNQIKREDIRRYLFIITFIVLLLLQSLFILVPIAISIRHHHGNSKISSTTPVIVTQTTTTTTTTVKPPTVKSAVKDVVKIMSRNLYNRFINAFKDENEITSNEKRPPLISDEKLEDTFKTIKNGINNIKSTNSEEQKSSRFQRWIIHYLKAPFQKWETKTNDEQINPNIKEDEEESIDLSSSSESDEDDEDEDDDFSETDDDNIIKQISSKDDEDSDEDEEDDNKNLVTKLSSSIADDDEDSAGESDEDDEESTTDTIKEQIPETIETVQNLVKTVNNQLQDNLSSSTNQDDEESGNESDEIDDEEKISKLSEMIKETLADPIEKVKNVASDIKNKIISSTDKEDEESISITEQIKQHLAKPIETIKDFGENVVANVKDKLSSSKSIDEEDSKIESDKEEEEEEKDSSILNRVKENVVKPIETAATNLHEKISSNVEKLKHKATNLVNSTEEFASNILKKSSGFVKEKNKKIKEVLPKPNKIKSKVKHEILEPLQTKASKVKKVLSTKSEHIKKAAVNKIKSLKQKKKPKTLTEKVKAKFHSLSKTLREKQEKKKVKKKIQNKLNGLFDEAWNIWHQTKTNLEHIFTLSTKHARHLPRYNTTSLYTAYTDLKCYDYTKISNRYRLLKYKYMYFLDTYRHHSPFPVYLSILKSNGPKCYRHYPDSTCGLILQSSNKSFKVQLYRFVRFWALIGIIVVILGGIYKNLTTRKQTNSPSFHRYNEDFDRSSNKNQKQTTISNKNDLSKPTTTNQNQQTNLSNTNTRPLDNQIKKQLHLWLEHEQNDGFRNLSEICRIAINNTFLKQLVSYSLMTFSSL